MEKLETRITKCTICNCGDVVEKRKSTMLIYGRNGPRLVEQVESRCNSRHKSFSCGAGYYHGYCTYDGKKYINGDALKEKVLVVTDQTDFDIDYLVEVVGRVHISSTTFEGATKEYNWFHSCTLPQDVLDYRSELHMDRLSEAYYLFTFLEFCQRYGIKDYNIIETTLGEKILQCKNVMLNKFRERWTVNH